MNSDTPCYRCGHELGWHPGGNLCMYRDYNDSERLCDCPEFIEEHMEYGGEA